ncbi:hypothetical protein [Phytohabitans houttuyneae]|uniref:SMODS and SLOG-associating 2TM effector domain-containing protein n=1 Tax=Phytohabitans houttuyneae TaxID=1076126 RepID=A0A6V8KFS9_9ACTN|nr:hypothetical protein Phou_050660 [Phytohabitans houttuyneae]
METGPMPGHIVRIPEVAKSTLRSLLDRHRTTYVPSWEENAFGRLSGGLFWEADRAWRRHRRLHRLWTGYHYAIGTTSVVLAATAGFGGLSELLDAKQAAVVALASAVAGALATFLGSDKKRAETAALASAWDSFRDDISITYETRPGADRADRAPPPGWEVVLADLQQRAKRLRAGVADPPAQVPAWPGHPAGSQATAR